MTPGTARGTLGAVAAGDPRAAVVGLSAIADGGNAFDAVLAAAATQWVVMPDMCGPGGDLFALIVGNGQQVAVNASGPAPAAGTGPGAAASTVPAAVSGMEAVAGLGARRPLADVFTAAQRIAARGFAISPSLAWQVDHSSEELRQGLIGQWGSTESGSVVRWPAMAATLGELACVGPDALLSGQAGTAGVTAASEWESSGSRLTADDLRSGTASVLEPLRIDLGAWQVGGQPPVSQGVVTLLALRLLGTEGRDELAAGTARGAHLGIEAIKAAFALAAGVVTEDGADVAQKVLDDEPRATGIRLGPLATDGPTITAGYGETTHVAAADADGNVVSLLHSLYRPFGARVLSPSTGIILNDRGDCFTMSGPGSAAPGRRPPHTLANVSAIGPRGIALALGTPGANAQVQTVAQVIVGLLHEPPERWAEVLDEPRWAFWGGRDVAVENRLDRPSLDDLAGRGHRLVSRASHDWLAGAVGVAASTPQGPLAAQDTRRAGVALAL